MPLPVIRVLSHYRPLLMRCTQAGYPEALARLADEVLAGEPWAPIARRMVLAAGEPPPGADPLKRLRTLAETGMEGHAQAELHRLIACKAPRTPQVECHLFPCLRRERRGAFTCAPGKMLLFIPLMPRWPQRLVRNIAHEYSHCLRMARWPHDERHGFGPARPMTVRDLLVFEGLAS